MNQGKEFLRPADIAPLLGVTTGRIYQLIAAGEIPAVRLGRAWRVPRAAWDEWLQEKVGEALAAVRPSGPMPGVGE